MNFRNLSLVTYLLFLHLYVKHNRAVTLSHLLVQEDLRWVWVGFIVLFQSQNAIASNLWRSVPLL